MSKGSRVNQETREGYSGSGATVNKKTNKANRGSRASKVSRASRANRCSGVTTAPSRASKGVNKDNPCKGLNSPDGTTIPGRARVDRSGTITAKAREAGKVSRGITAGNHDSNLSRVPSAGSRGNQASRVNPVVSNRGSPVVNSKGNQAARVDLPAEACSERAVNNTKK